jgi:hypothetical protein
MTVRMRLHAGTIKESEIETWMERAKQFDPEPNEMIEDLEKRRTEYQEQRQREEEKAQQERIRRAKEKEEEMARIKAHYDHEEDERERMRREWTEERRTRSIERYKVIWMAIKPYRRWKWSKINVQPKMKESMIAQRAKEEAERKWGKEDLVEDEYRHDPSKGRNA